MTLNQKKRKHNCVQAKFIRIDHDWGEIIITYHLLEYTTNVCANGVAQSTLKNSAGADAFVSSADQKVLQCADVRRFWVQLVRCSFIRFSISL